MGGKRFVARLAWLVHTTLVRGDRDLRFLHRLGQAFGGVGRFRRVAEVELELIGVFAIPLAAVAIGLLQQFVDRELLLNILLLELRERLLQLDDRLGLRGDRVVLLADRLLQLGNELLTGGEIVGSRQCVVHGFQHNNSPRKLKSTCSESP